MLADSTSSTISVTLSTLSTGFNILMRLVRITACLSDVHGPLGQVQVVKTIHAIGDEAGAVELLVVRGYVGGYRADYAFVE